MQRSVHKLLFIGAAALFLGALCVQSSSYAGNIEHLLNPGGQAASSVAPAKAGKSSPPAKFTATGTVNVVLDNGPCANSVVSSCSSGCDQFQISGPVQATSLGKSTFSACITIDNSTVATQNNKLNACFNGLGTGTVTAANGSTIKLGIGGLICISDEFPLPTPNTLVFVLNDGYSVEGGSGKFSTANGTGTVAASMFFAVPQNLPGTGAGQISLVGALGK